MTLDVESDRAQRLEEAHAMLLSQSAKTEFDPEPYERAGVDCIAWTGSVLILKHSLTLVQGCPRRRRRPARGQRRAARWATRFRSAQYQMQ